MCGLRWSMVCVSLSSFCPAGTSHLTLIDESSISTGLRSERIRKGIKFWVERLTVNPIGELSFRGT